ncbi:MAG: hypothetical protein RJA22_496 [Verrucomicrobiota bacterium]
MRLFVLELRLLARERAALVLTTLFAAALAWGLWNGARVESRHREDATALAAASDQFLAQVRQALAQQAVDPRAVARGGSLVLLPAAPLGALAVGQSDLTPRHETLSVFRLRGAGDSSSSDLQNPSALLAGRFDLAFVLVWLLPLFLLALTHDLLAGDRESGTLRLALAQGARAWTWTIARAAARATPILALALLATLATGLAGPGPGPAGATRLLLATAAVLAYGFFWVALALAVNVSARSAAGAAAALGAAWVLLVLVAPTLLNVAVETIHPTPSRPELVAAARRASSDAEKRGGEVLMSFYRDHPELAPPGQQADFAAQHLAVQEEVGKAIDPVRRRFDEQLALQQATVARWRAASPAIALQEALTDLAGTGYWRHRAFHDQVEVFKDTLLNYYGTRIHRRESLTAADLAALPRFQFQEEPAGAWRARASLSLAGILAATTLLAAYAGWRLRPTAAGRLAG